MRISQGTGTLVALEDSGVPALFRTAPGSDEPIWPHLRMELAQAMASVELGTESVSEPTGARRGAAISRYGRAFLPGQSSVPRSTKPTLCFFAGGTTIRRQGDVTQNWLIDPFARSIAHSVVVQSRPLDARPDYPSTWSLDAAFARLDVLHRLRPLREPPLDEVKQVVAAIAPLLEVPISKPDLEDIARRVSYRLSRVEATNRMFTRLLDRMCPDIVVMEDASYGAYGNVIRLMKQRGVHVVEPQHGWIGPSHAAYNFGAAMREPELLGMLPDAVLTFGEFWSTSIRHPGSVVAIGKPHMDAMRQDLLAFEARPRTVLIASSVSDPEAMSSFVLEVRDALPDDWTVVFRPHPSERSTQELRYARLVDAHRIQFDTETDVYESMRRSRAVIGVASTVLYEALAMGCHVFVRDSPYSDFYIDDVFGEPIRGADGVAHLAATLSRDAPPALSPEELEAFWMPNAVDNFARYIDSIRNPSDVP